MPASRRRPRRRSTPLAAALVAAALVGACRGDDGNEAGPAAATTSVTGVETTSPADPTAARPPRLENDVDDPVAAMTSIFALEEWSNLHPDQALPRVRSWVAAGSELEDRIRRQYRERAAAGVVQEGGRRRLLETRLEERGGVVVRHATLLVYVSQEAGALVARDGTRTEIAAVPRALVVYELFLSRDGRWRVFDRREGPPPP